MSVLHFREINTQRSDWEGKGPCAIASLTWKMAHQSLCRMIRNVPLKISKSLKKAENGPLAKNLFPITASENNQIYSNGNVQGHMCKILGIAHLNILTDFMVISGYSPIFDESFEFQINLPDLALVRFAVLDDDYIGDEFIGQYTIPFECMQTGKGAEGHRYLELISYGLTSDVCKQVRSLNGIGIES